MSTFLDLQNGWYNGFIQGMGQTDKSFQIIQPAPPLLDQDAVLWAYFNNIPPDSLTQNYIASGGNQFYSNYRGLMSALVPTRVVDVKEDIGVTNFNNWQAYVNRLVPPPSPNQLPTIFRSWAMMNAPSVATRGASDYAAILLDPVASAQTELTLVYTDANGQAKPCDWSLGYNDLKNQLAMSPNRSFTFDSSTMNTKVSSSWTGGSNSGFFGLWGGSSSQSSISKKFASNTIHLEASFNHVLTFVASPGNWYSSSAIGLAYANQKGNPWSPDSSINWNNTFGSDGNMQRFMSNLIVCSDMHVRIISSAQYSSEEQTEIHNSSHHGFWPFYSGGGGGSSTNTATFNQEGNMTVITSSAAGVPVVLGGNVLSAGEFVGHTDDYSNLLLKSLSALA